MYQMQVSFREFTVLCWRGQECGRGQETLLVFSMSMTFFFSWRGMNCILFLLWLLVAQKFTPWYIYIFLVFVFVLCSEEHFMEEFCQRCRKCSDYCVEEHVLALGHSWHKSCLSCQCCGVILDTDDSIFGGPEDKMPYCKLDFGRLFGCKCAGCGEIIEHDLLEALGHKWHVHCFCCGACDKQLGNPNPNPNP